MNNEVKALRDLLVADSAVTDKLDTYASAPAVFDTEAPQDFESSLGYIVVQDIANVPWDTHSDTGLDGVYDVRCYAPRTGSMAALRDIAEAARLALHRKRPTVPGRETASTWVSGGPSPLPLEITMVGLGLTVRMLTDMEE